VSYSRTRIACYTGYVTQAIVVNLAPLLFVIFQKNFSFSIGFIAAITLITFVVQMGIDVAAIYFVEKTSYRFLAVSSQAVSCVGLWMLAFVPGIIEPHVGILIAVFVYSTGSGLCEVVLSPLIEAIPEDENKNRSAMTLMHSFYAWGQAVVILFTTVILSIIGDDLWWALPLIWSILPFGNALIFTKVPLADMTVHSEGHGVSKILRSKEFLLAFMLMICAGASEQAMAQWSSFFCEKGLGVSKVIGDILGPCTFACMMGIGRTVHGLFGARLNMSRLLKCLSAFCVLCYAATVFVPVPFVSLIACGVCGLGVSVMWPGMLTLCSSRYPKSGASMFAILALGGDIGCSLGPWLCGTVSEFAAGITKSNISIFKFISSIGLDAQQFGLRAGFLSSMIFPLLMLFGIVLLSKSGKEKYVQ